MNGMRIARACALLVMLAALAACGGEGEQPVESATAEEPPVALRTTDVGVFKHSNVAGLTYSSGESRGVTDPNGEFEYEAGQPITFSVGGIKLGSAASQPTVTPVDLVEGGSSATPAVQNIARFLMMLDSDANVRNGINISHNLRGRAASWPQVNFSADNFGESVSTIIADAKSADGGTHVLPDATTARNHLEATFLCAYSGAFRGMYSGAETGRLGLLVTPHGWVLGVGFSVDLNGGFGVSSIAPVGIDQTRAFTAQGEPTTLLSGRLLTVDELMGSWNKGGGSGMFSGTRIGGGRDAIYRFAGFYSDPASADAGLFAFDVNSADEVAGLAYSLTFDRSVELTGSVSGTTLSATTTSGVIIKASIFTGLGQLDGTWTGSGSPGTFDGTGCKLN
jgi:hypothetical protein